MNYTIDVSNVGQILSTKQPLDLYDALVCFLSEYFLIDIDFLEASDEESVELNRSQDSGLVDSTPLLERECPSGKAA